jgi:hypothetical protein
MIGKILGSGQLGKLATFVSPAFFDVMPARALLARGKQLLSDSRDSAKIQQVVAQRAQALAPLMPELQLRLPLEIAVPPLAPGTDPAGASWRGALVAELYFRQLFLDAPLLLDLRATAFSTDGRTLAWSPAAWIAELAPEFIEPLRDIYLGFYRQDDLRFRGGLKALNLAHSEDLFREQFGAGQEQVLFRVRAFIDVFHRVFERCKQQRTSLHPDFLPLGIYLAALYDHEQELAVPVDVCAAFAKATAGLVTPDTTSHTVQEPKHA